MTNFPNVEYKIHQASVLNVERSQNLNLSDSQTSESEKKEANKDKNTKDEFPPIQTLSVC